MTVLSKTPIVLENPKVRLEPLATEHLPYLLPIAEKHPNLLQYSPAPFGTEENLKAYIDNAIVHTNNGLWYSFTIYDKTLNKYIGSTSYMAIVPTSKRLEIGGSWIEKEAQGTGINKQCKHLLLTYAFDVLQYERVELKTDYRNTQSRKAIEKIGASFEGVLRSHTVLPDGFRRDTVYYSILKSEWPTLKITHFNNL